MRNKFSKSTLLCLASGTFGVLLLTALTAGKNASSKNWSASSVDSSGIVMVKNNGGPTLGYSTNSGVKILTVDGLAFKDLNKNGKLDKYEDWRLPVDERAKDPASKMAVDTIVGLIFE